MSGVDVLAVMGDDRYAVPARIKDVIDSLKFDEKMRGHNPDRSTVDFPYAISILEAQAAKIAEARAAVAELIEAARQASATLGHAYHTTLTGQLSEYAHNDYSRLDAAIAACGVAK